MTYLPEMMQGYRPLSAMSEDEKFEDAIQNCLKVCIANRRGSGFYVLDYDETTKAAHELFEPVHELIGSSEEKKFVGFNVVDLSRKGWGGLLKLSEETRSLVLQNASINLALGRQLPPNLTGVIAGYLFSPDTYPAPTRKKPKQTHRNLLLTQLAIWVTERYGYDFGNADTTLEAGPPYPTTGTLVAASAMHALGVSLDPRRANKLAYEHKKIIQSKDFTSIGVRLVALALNSKNALLTQSLGDVRDLLPQCRAYFNR